MFSCSIVCFLCCFSILINKNKITKTDKLLESPSANGLNTEIPHKYIMLILDNMALKQFVANLLQTCRNHVLTKKFIIDRHMNFVAKNMLETASQQAHDRLV